jgi:tetratricopeptide (TPR) repeat protein
MPATYNGIGTHYYGKKNVERRDGACPHCGAHVQLSSYDTRLWFVVVFIPVIPLGRKRIVDQCPSCTRHFAVDADKWETSKQLEISGAQEKFRAAPTPEAAVAVHQQLLQFHEFEQATEFRRLLNTQFPDHAKLHAHLGAALSHFSKHAEAAPCFARALELRPDLPEARVGVAAEHIRGGRLTQARDLLDFLLKPGAAQLYSLEPVETLGRAFQNAGHHEEALELFTRLQAELPTLVEHRGFRKLVEKSEKSLGRKQSQLPKLKFSWRRMFQSRGPRSAGSSKWPLLAGGLLVAAIILGLAISNEYIRRHRTLHLVNATGQPASVQIDGVEAVKNFRGVQEYILAEGPHHAVISGATRQELDFEVRGDYFGRWGGDPAWVINVDGAAVLLSTAVVYSQNPPPPSVSVHFGQPFEAFWKVTHPFRDLPDSVRMKANEQRTLIDLQLYRGESSNLFNYFVRQNQLENGLGFAEAWLKRHPDDESLLRSYGAVSGTAAPRVEAFIRQGLAARPVRIEWHRLYQRLREKPATQAAVVAEYDGFLRAEPDNSALLYLRGRLAAERAVARDYFERAARLDSHNAYAPYALGYDYAVRGDWSGAKPLFAAASKLRPTDSGFGQVLFLTRLAVGEASALEMEMKQQLAHDPIDAVSSIRLIDCLAAQGRSPEALQAAETFARAATAKYAKEAESGNRVLRTHALYATGDLAGLEKFVTKVNDHNGRSTLALVLVEEGRPAEAAKLAAAPGLIDDPTLFALGLSLAFRQIGNDTDANRQIEAACKALAAGDNDAVQAAALLRSSTPPTLSAVEDLVLQPQEKAALVAILAQRHPSLRGELAAFARKLNVERTFPFHLVQSVTSAAR